jgi:hypothetical protein
VQFNGKFGEDCGWHVVKEISIPPAADFVDYSGMAFRGEKVGTLACCPLRFTSARDMFHGLAERFRSSQTVIISVIYSGKWWL